MKNEKTMQKWTVCAAVIVALVVLVAALAVVGLNTPAQTAYADPEPEHTHDGYTAWESDNSLPTSPGSYYLTKDVTISGTWRAPVGTTNLCLNGHGIKKTDYGSVIWARDYKQVVLNLYDCGSTVHYYDVDENDMAININETAGVGRKSFTGGYIAGGERTDSYGGAIWVEVATFNMYGGTILGNQAGIGGGVYVSTQGTFNMYGGTIMHNKASGTPSYLFAGGGVQLFEACTFNMYGGDISYNYSAKNGGGVAFSNYADQFTMSGGTISHNNAVTNGGGVYKPMYSSIFYLSGNPVIGDNTANSANNNVYIDSVSKKNILTLSGALTKGASVGVTLYRGSGVFTDGWSNFMDAANPATYFVPDNDMYDISLDSGEAKLAAHIHNDITFTAWDKNNSLPTAAGSYYLTQDVTVTGTWAVPTGVTNLCLNGHSIRKTDFTRITVNNGCTLNLYECDDTVKYVSYALNNYYDEITAVSAEAPANGTEWEDYIVVNGGFISTPKAQGVYVDAGGTFNMYGGTVCLSSRGVAVSSDTATFNMYGGTICACHNNPGVYTVGTTTIAGGVIEQNVNSMLGGGIYAERGTVTVSGGVIRNNRTNESYYDGGGIYMQTPGTLYITGGEISGNEAGGDGGGVYCAGELHLSGGSITGNHAGGNGGGMALTEKNYEGLKRNYFSGNPVVQNNTAGEGNAVNNIYTDTYKLVVDGAFTDGAYLSVTMKTPGVFTEGLDGNLPAGKTVGQVLYSDTLRYGVTLDGTEATLIAQHCHDETVFTTAWESNNSLPDAAGSYYLTQDVTMNDYDTWTVPTTGTTNLCLNGHSIVFGSFSRIEMEGGTLNLYDCGDATHYITVDGNGLFNSVSDSDPGDIEIEGGFIASKVGSNAVHMFSGTFNMYGGTICCSYSGVGVGAYDESAAFNMHGGAISYNLHGGVSVGDNGTFTMDAGEISHNASPWYGGGVSCRGNVTISGGTISNNRGQYGGIYMSGGTLNLSGAPVIQNNENLDSDPLNVYLYTSGLITINDELTNATPIGVTMQTPGKFTNNDVAAYKDNFTSDDPDYVIKTTANNALTLALAHVHSFTYTVSGATITATCGNAECDLPENKATLTLVGPTGSLVYDGNAKTATIQAGYNAEAFPSATIVYYKNNAVIDTCIGVGSYVATVTFGDARAEVPFTISKATPDYEIPTGLNATYGDTLADVELPAGWAWDEEDTTAVGNAGNRAHNATFTPADTVNYETATETLTIAVSKANPAYTVPTGLSTIFNKTLSSVTLPDGWAWNDSTTNVGNEAGDFTFKAKFTPADTDNYNLVENIDISVNVHEHVHTFDYTVDGAVITATCNNTDECPYASFSATLTLSPYDNLVYDGTQKWIYTEYAVGTEYIFEPFDVYYYKDNVLAYPINVGTYVARATVHGVTAEITFTITPAGFGDYNLTLSTDTLTYTGEEQSVAATVLHKDGGIPLQEGTHYTLSDQKATEVGEYTLTITGIGNYSGTKTATYHVVPANIEGMGIDAPEGGFDENYIYAVTPWTTTNIHYWGNVNGGEYVTWPGAQMESLGNGLFRYPYPALRNDDTAVFLIFDTNGGSEQTADLKDSKEVALGSVYFVTAKQPGQDHAATSFKSRDQQRAIVTRVANRADVEKVEFGGNTLTVNVDYAVSYKTSEGVDIAKPTLPGDYIVVVKGTGNYTGVVENEFTLTHAHDFTYTVDGATITATCGNPDCYVTEGLTLTLVAPTESLVYDGEAKVATITEGYNDEAFPNATIVYYKADEIVDTCVSAGTYAAKVVMGDVAATVTFVIAKANPDYDVPDGLTAIYGELLGTIALPDGWAWTNVNRIAGNAGTRHYEAVFTPDDTANYNVISMALTVEVAKAIPVYTIPAIVADYGQILADVSVPTGWSWADATADVGLVGVNTHKGIYTPIDTENYAVVDDIDVPVTVKWVLSNEKGSVRIDGEDEFDINVQVKVEVKTDIETKTKKSDYGKAAKKSVSAGEKIAFVYEVKLLRTTIVGGVETLAEIQPSDIKPGTTIEVSMEIPEALRGKAFKVLHIHSNTDAEFVDYTVSKDGKYLTVTTNRLSDFAFVVNVEAHGFCIGWIVFIFVMLLLLYTALYLIVWLPQTAKFAAKCKLDKVKQQRSKMVLLGFVNLLLLIGIAASCAIWIFALVALCCHVCPVTIVCFVLATLILIFYGLILWCEWAKSKKVKGGEKAEPKADEESPATATDNRDLETKASETIPAAVPVVETSGENDIVSMADADEEDEEGGVVVDAKGNYFNIRYSKSFLAKLIQSPDETKGYYGKLKNEVLSYKKTKSRVSWAYDSVNAGRSAVVKFGIRGKTLCVYFALNADDYADTKYKVEKVESKKYEAVPCMYRIKNERRLGYAKDLIAAVAAQLGLTKGIVGTEDYYLPYESTEALIGKGLIKELKLAATTTQIERAKAEGTIKVVTHVDASEVNALISDEMAAAAIQVADTKSVHTGKKCIINVDTLSLHFADGDTVTIEKLKAMKLIPAKYEQVKLLARGRLDKKLHVELQDYSIEAVKMVLLTGGTVKKV